MTSPVGWRNWLSKYASTTVIESDRAFPGGRREPPRETKKIAGMRNGPGGGSWTFSGRSECSFFGGRSLKPGIVLEAEDLSFKFGRSGSGHN
jgi:hypothetical protein